MAEAVARAAFEDVFRRWHGPIFGYFYNRLRDVDTAHDLTGDVFVRAWEAWGGYVSRLPVQAWLMQIARNRLVDFYRSQGTFRGARQMLALDSDEFLRLDRADWEGAIEERVVFEGRWAQLTEPQRAALSLAAAGYDDLAGGAAMGISRRAFRSVVFRGRRALERLGTEG